MIKSLKKILLGLAFLPNLVFAQKSNIIFDSTTNPGGLPTFFPGDRTGGTIGGTISAIILMFLSVVGLISVAYIIYGGFRYVTSGGNSETTAAAKKTIVNALIGLIIVILSYVMVRLVTNAALNGIR